MSQFTPTAPTAASPLVSNIRRLPTPSGPRFEVRHHYIRVTARRGYWCHYAWDTSADRGVQCFRTIGPAMTAVQALNAGGAS